MIKAVYIFYCLASVCFVSKRLMRYLRFLQQDAYSKKRFIQWLWTKKAFDRRGTLTAAATAALSYFSPAFIVVGGLVLFGWFFFEEDPRKHGKLKLCFTSRAKRIFSLALLFHILVQVALLAFKGAFRAQVFWFFQILLFQLTPFWLVLSVSLLSLDEKRRQRRYIAEAKERLKHIDPLVIGITGSYGKTSTKDALGHILQVTLGATFWPEKGVNTAMGIVREIRKKLEKGTSYAVVEMGAYKKGSIARLCQLTPPRAGIITTIGVAHLDRFKDQETIRAAKSELAQAIPPEGILVCNGDNQGTRQIAQDFPKRVTLLYGYDNQKQDLDCWIVAHRFTGTKTIFTFQLQGMQYTGETSLIGKAALSNLAAAFTMAQALGADPKFVLGAIANLLPVENRLERCCKNEVTYLKDAYNSNPEGFEAALEALSCCKANNRILMTPGMVELSSLEGTLHERIGKQAAKVCDKVIIVGETNRKSLMKGLQSGGMSKEKIFFAEHRAMAFNILDKIVQPQDAVLIENDLPDLYEGKENF